MDMWKIKKKNARISAGYAKEMVGVMHINHQCDWLGRQLFQFHGQCHISLPYNLRGRFNGNESWSLSELNAGQFWTWGSRMWNVVTLPGLRNWSAVNAYWPGDVNLLLWSLPIVPPVENVQSHQHTKWHMLINIHAGGNAGHTIAPRESGHWHVSLQENMLTEGAVHFNTKAQPFFTQLSLSKNMDAFYVDWTGWTPPQNGAQESPASVLWQQVFP